MRALLQRVSEAAVRVDGEEIARIGPGLLVLIGIADGDCAPQAKALADKTVGLRIFPDFDEPERKPMNRSLLDVGGQLLVVSQFTLAASTDKGRRPGFSTAAKPEIAEPLVAAYVDAARELGARVSTGRFGADMKVALVNDGPVTFVLDS